MARSRAHDAFRSADYACVRSIIRTIGAHFAAQLRFSSLAFNVELFKALESPPLQKLKPRTFMSTAIKSPRAVLKRPHNHLGIIMKHGARWN